MDVLLAGGLHAIAELYEATDTPFDHSVERIDAPIATATVAVFDAYGFGTEPTTSSINRFPMTTNDILGRARCNCL